MLILFLPALTAANTSSHTTLSCIALCLYIFLQLSLQASGLQQNSFCGSSSHRNCCQAPVALRGQPAQETGKWRVGCEPCLLPFTAWPQPVASTFLGSEQMEEQPNLSLLSSPLPNRVQAMEATGREQSCQITGLGNQMQFFCFLFFQSTSPLWEWSFCPTWPQLWDGFVTKVGRFSTNMVPLGDVSSGCIHPSKTKLLLLLVPDGVCLCPSL